MGREKRNKLTSVGDLAGVATGGGGSPLREGRANLGQTLKGCAGADSVVFGHGDLGPLAVRALDLGGDGDDLVMCPPRSLRLLGSLEALCGELVHALPVEAKVPDHVLARPAHGLQAVGGILALGYDSLIERLASSALVGHALGTNSDTDGDGVVGNGVGDVGNGLQAG